MPWYSQDWQYRIKLTVQSSQVEGGLTNFPVYVNLGDLPNDFHSNVDADGSDIRITNYTGQTELPRELVYYTGASDLGELHFRADSLSGSSSLDFYLYYGNAGASDYSSGSSFGSNNVWDSQYAGVYHMQQDPSGSAPQLVDSTSVGNDGTAAGSMTSADLVAGQVGNALEFDGVDDEINLGNLGLLTAALDDEFTLSCWIKWDGSGKTFATPIGIQSFVGSFTFASGAFGVQSDGANSGEFAAADIDTNTWQRMCVQYIEGSKYIGIKGASKVFDVATTDTEGDDGNSAFIADGSGSANNRNIGAIIDEVRISSVARSTDWEFTEYNNQVGTSSFFVIGSQESNAGTSVVAEQINPYRAVLLNGNFYNFSQQREAALLSNSSTDGQAQRVFSVLGRRPSEYPVTIHLENDYVVRAGSSTVGSTTWLGVSRLQHLIDVLGALGDSQPIYYVDIAGSTHNIVASNDIAVSMYRPSNPSDNGAEFTVTTTLLSVN